MNLQLKLKKEANWSVRTADEHAKLLQKNKNLYCVLWTFSKALFETPELLHEAQKLTLADSIWSLAKQKLASLPGTTQYVLGGGALLHRIPWQRGSTFGAILDIYVDFVLRNYAQGITFFDGYESFSTKDMTHKYQSKGKKSVSVAFTPVMKLTVTKDVFFSNPSNK